MRLIDADELKKVIFSKSDNMEDLWDTAGVLNAINNASTVEERPTGDWITVYFARNELNCPEKSMLDFVKCPFCETIHQGRHNFCSRCGADMRNDCDESLVKPTDINRLREMFADYLKGESTDD